MRKIKFRVYSKVLKKMINWESLMLKGINLQAYFKGMTNLMQFIGLKDKNGKEIYEGDVVSFNNVIGFVDFGYGKYNCYYYENKHPMVDEIFSHINEIEVIGNIYENPELLKTKEKGKVR